MSEYKGHDERCECSPEDMTAALEERRRAADVDAEHSLADGVGGGSRLERQGGFRGSAPEHIPAAGAETSRGRPPLPKPAPEPLPDFDPEVKAGLEAGQNIQALVAADQTRQQLELSEMLGRIRTVDFMNQFTGMARLKWLKELKESKAYRGQKALGAQGETVTLNTFEQLCELLGTSYSKVAEDLQNLQLLGEAFMDASQHMGLGYRQLRTLRALPEDDRQYIRQIVDEDRTRDDPAAMKAALEDALEELVSKQARDKEQLKKERDEARADLDASRKVADETSKKLTRSKEELARLKNISPDERELLQAEKEKEALKELNEKRLVLRGAFTGYLVGLRALLDLDDVRQSTVREIMDMSSALCAGMADDLLMAGVDIDLRKLIYPMPCPERGDELAMAGEAAGVHGGPDEAAAEDDA